MAQMGWKGKALFVGFLSVVLLTGCIPGINQGGRRLHGPEFEILRDPSRNMTVEDVSATSAEQWKRNLQSDPRFSYSSDAFWIRLRPGEFISQPVASADHDRIVVQISYVYLDFLDAWQVNSRGDIRRLASSGDRRPFADWTLKHRSPSVIIANHEANNLLYVRIVHEGPIRLPITVFSEAEHFWFVQVEYFLLGGYFGTLLVMLLYNLFVGLSVREPVYLLYVAYLAATIVYALFLLGLGLQFAWPSHPWWNNYGLNCLAAATVFIGCLFSWSFLDVSRNFPRLKWIVVALLISAALLVPVSLLVSYQVGLVAVSYAGAAATVITLALGVILVIRGKKEARFFVLAWAVMIVNVILASGANLGLFENPVGLYGIQIGSYAEMILLSFALGDRINFLRLAKETAQKETVAVKERMTDRLSIVNQRLSILLTATRDLFNSDDVKGALDSFAVQFCAAGATADGRLYLGLEPQLAHLAGGECLVWPSENSSSAVHLPMKQDGSGDSVWKHTPLDHAGVRLGTLSWKPVDSRASDPLAEGLIQSLAISLNSIRLAGQSRLTVVGEFAAGLVHEIKNDMTAIRYLSEAIKPDGPASPALSALRKSLGDLSALAEDVLDYAREELRPGLAPVAAADLIVLLRESALEVLENTSIDFKCESATLAGNVEVDPKLIRRLARNLASNSAQAIGTRSAVFQIRTNNTEGRFLEIIFSDNGPGIPVSLRPTLFVPFVSRGKVGGTGVGLAFARRIAEVHRGSLTLHESQQEGAAFLLRLPLQEIESR